MSEKTIWGQNPTEQENPDEAFFQDLQTKLNLSEEQVGDLRQYERDYKEMLELEVYAAQNGFGYEAGEEMEDKVTGFEAAAREVDGAMWKAIKHLKETRLSQFSPEMDELDLTE